MLRANSSLSINTLPPDQYCLCCRVRYDIWYCRIERYFCNAMVFCPQKTVNSKEYAVTVMNQKRLCLLLVLALFAFPAQAERPKIGLALAGGGAKGSAHIAVLELLEANNIPVDYIAGTSIGAYIGGLYALGHSAAEIRQIMYSADLGSGFSDAIDREKLPYRVKRQHDKFNAGLELGYGHGELLLPWGVLYGQSMSMTFRRSVGNIPNFASFDELAIPFRAVATDLATSNTVVLDHGDLLRAMKASATVPGALVPVNIEGKFLVDGGMAENLPVKQVKLMGADIIIAVDISAPLLDIDEISNALSVLEQISSFLTVKNIDSAKEFLDDGDIYIRPDIDHLSTSNFSAMNEAFNAGKAAAEQQLEALQRLSIDAGEYLQYQRQKRRKLDALKLAGERPVAKIILTNNSHFNDDFLLHSLGLETDLPISSEELNAAIDRLYSLDRFELVEAVFEDTDVGRVLIVDVVEKSWGPNYLEMGLGWEDDFTLDSIIDLDFAYTVGNITDNNGEWRNELGIGTNKNFRSEVHLPLDKIQRFYLSAVYEYSRENKNVFIENERALILDQKTYRLDLGLGYKLGHLSIAEVGFTFERGDINNEVFLGDDVRYRTPGVFLRYGYDSLDRISFPSQGNRLTMALIHRDEDVSGEPIFDNGLDQNIYRSTQFLLDWKGATSRGNNGIIGQASLAYLDSEIDESIHYVALGGFLNLSGYHRDALIGNKKVFGVVAYQYNLGRSLFGLKNFPIFVGASIEAGNVWPASESINFAELIAAGSIYMSTDSKLGPVALAYGFTEDNNSSIYFYLGKNI
jgi:NTE family protein